MGYGLGSPEARGRSCPAASTARSQSPAVLKVVGPQLAAAAAATVAAAAVAGAADDVAADAEAEAAAAAGADAAAAAMPAGSAAGLHPESPTCCWWMGCWATAEPEPLLQGQRRCAGRGPWPPLKKPRRTCSQCSGSSPDHAWWGQAQQDHRWVLCSCKQIDPVLQLSAKTAGHQEDSPGAESHRGRELGRRRQGIRGVSLAPAGWTMAGLHLLFQRGWCVLQAWRQSSPLCACSSSVAGPGRTRQQSWQGSAWLRARFTARMSNGDRRLHCLAAAQ